MYSTAFKALSETVSNLRQKFLPSKFPDTPPEYSEKELGDAAAFRLFSHAAIETYIEEEIRQVAIKSKSEADNENFDRVAVSVIIHFKKAKKLPMDLTQWGKNDEAALGNDSFQSLHRMLDANNGIKSKNLIPLLVAIGLKKTAIDPILFDELDSFGQRRGNLAHKVYSGKDLKNEIKPEEELRVVAKCLFKLRSLDRMLEGLL